EFNGTNFVTSGPATFPISPVSPGNPNITSLIPNPVQEGGGSFTLTVNGSGFVSGAAVLWAQNGVTTNLTPFSVNSNQLKVFVPSSLVALGHAGTVSVTVV